MKKELNFYYKKMNFEIFYKDFNFIKNINLKKEIKKFEEFINTCHESKILVELDKALLNLKNSLDKDIINDNELIDLLYHYYEKSYSLNDIQDTFKNLLESENKLKMYKNKFSNENNFIYFENIENFNRFECIFLSLETYYGLNLNLNLDITCKYIDLINDTVIYKIIEKKLIKINKYDNKIINKVKDDINNIKLYNIIIDNNLKEILLKNKKQVKCIVNVDLHVFTNNNNEFKEMVNLSKDQVMYSVIPLSL